MLQPDWGMARLESLMKVVTSCDNLRGRRMNALDP